MESQQQQQTDYRIAAIIDAGRAIVEIAVEVVGSLNERSTSSDVKEEDKANWNTKNC